jgi:FkbM family methyltransferase
MNPTSYGRRMAMAFAEARGWIPADGVYELGKGITMELQMRDYVDRAIYFDAFEFLGTRHVRRSLQNGGVFVDIGANIGYYTLLAHKRVTNSGRVLAFEPNPETANALRRNIELSGARNVEVFEVALSESPGEATIFRPVGQSHGLASMRNQGWAETEHYKVPAARLDDILPTNLQRIDFLKVDVEGAEGLVFRGAASTISRYKPAILMELNQDAASRFGCNCLETVRLVLSYNPAYQLRYLGDHSVRDVSLAEMEERGILAGNLLLS